MDRAFRALVAAALLAALPFGAGAHHSFSAEFDADKPVKVTGTVTKLDWRNPHAWFYVDVKDNNGNVLNWGFELASPNLLIRNGWTRAAIDVGSPVTVEGYQAKNGKLIANASSVMLTRTSQKLFTAPSKGSEK